VLDYYYIAASRTRLSIRFISLSVITMSLDIVSGSRAKCTCATFRRKYIATHCLLTKQTDVVPFGSRSSTAKAWQLRFLHVVGAEFVISSVKGFVNSNSLSARSCKERDEVEEVGKGTRYSC